MKKFHIKQLKKDVSVIGLGTMIFSPEKKDLAFDLMSTYLEKGGNLIDTAEIYGDPEEYGYSETTIGLWLEQTGKREDVVILGKGCIPGTCKPLHPNGSEISQQGIRNAIAGSLERLKTDYLDIWILHRDDPGQPVGPIMETLNEEINKGRIRCYGGSNWTVKRIREANEYAEKHGLIGMSISSPHFSLATAKEPYWPDTVITTPEDKEWYENTQFPLFAWSSLGRGFFAKGNPNNTEDKDLVRVYYSDDNFEKIRRVDELGKIKGVKGIEIALSYVVNQKFPVVALVGPARVEEMESCIKAAALDLTQEEVDWLDLKTATLR